VKVIPYLLKPRDKQNSKKKELKVSGDKNVIEKIKLDQANNDLDELMVLKDDTNNNLNSGRSNSMSFRDRTNQSHKPSGDYGHNNSQSFKDSSELEIIRENQEEKNTFYNNMIQRIRLMKEEQRKNYQLKRPIEFKVLYWMIWIQLFFINILYWLTSININYWKPSPDNEDSLYTLSVILLRYVPTIMMTLTYILIYF